MLQWTGNSTGLLMSLRIRAILEFQQNFGPELVVLHTKLSMLNKFSVHDWGWCGDLNEQHFMLVHCSSNSFWLAKRC